MELFSRSGLDKLVAGFAPGREPMSVLLEEIAALSEGRAAALFRALLREHQAQAGFADRSAHFDDLHQFDLRLNAIFCELLARRTPMDALLAPQHSGFFQRDAPQEDEELKALLVNGYQVSSHRLGPAQLARVRDEIADCMFVNKGIFTREATGRKILEGIEDGRLTRRPSKNGDTYWLRDQDELVRKDFFRELAFDPYILSMVARYLGCCPIHVQTNVWFSFPTFKDKWNLAANAQMFHQDKEFTKFIKVFIYLSDVGEDNGPHCYIEGSHSDEAHVRGVALSERIPDAEISRYYEAGRVRKLTGKAGAISFGDTSCVHKGAPVERGYRAMLQLEYAASLHLSPVCPFSGFPVLALSDLPYPAQLTARLLANYDSRRRVDFQLVAVAAEPSPSPSQDLVRKLLQMGKRYLPRQRSGDGP